MICVKYSTIICLFLCLHNNAQSSTLTQDKDKFSIDNIFHNPLTVVTNYMPSFWKGSSSPSTTSKVFYDYHEDGFTEWKSSFSTRVVRAQEETDLESQETTPSSFDAWVEPSDSISDDTPLTLDTLPAHLFFNLLKTSEQKHTHPVALYPQAYTHKEPERDIYQQLFFNALRPTRYSHPLSVVELYPTPRPRIAATVESFSLLPRDEPNSKA